jgi:hypothetical protein
MQPGDVPATYADVDELMHEVDFRPKTPIAEGIGRFVEWYPSFDVAREGRDARLLRTAGMAPQRVPAKFTCIAEPKMNLSDNVKSTSKTIIRKA